MNLPPDSSKLRSRSLEVLSCVIIFFCCLWVPTQARVPRMELALQSAALESDRHADRIADWAAQLPLGEALREGIVGFAIA